MNDILFGKLINHGGNCLEQFERFDFVSHRLQLLNKSPGGLVLILVSQTLGFVCTDSLKCRFVICHILNLLNVDLQPFFPKTECKCK